MLLIYASIEQFLLLFCRRMSAILGLFTTYYRPIRSVFHNLFVDFFKWICVSLCVSLNLFLLTFSTWYILIYIGYVLNRNLGRKYTINNRPFYLAQFLLSLSRSLQSHDKIMINKHILNLFNDITLSYSFSFSLILSLFQHAFFTYQK